MIDIAEGLLWEPAEPGAVAATEAVLGRQLPEDYGTFMREHNGADVWVGECRLCLWKLEQLAERNAGLEMQQHMPNLLIFGGDGGDEAFAFNVTTEPWSVVAVPFDNIEMEAIVQAAPTFAIFLDKLQSGWTVDKALREQRTDRSVT